MYKIIAIPVRFTDSNIFQSTIDGRIRFIDDLSLQDFATNQFVRLGLYVVANERPSPYIPHYLVTDSDGSFSAIADSLNNDKPSIPDWLVKAWIKNPEIQFDVKVDPITHRLIFESEVSPESSQQDRELKSFLNKIKVTKDDFEVIQLTKNNNFMLRHKKSQRTVFLEKKLHRGFFAGLDYQIQQESWKFGENHEEVLVLKPLTKIVIL